MDDYFVDVTDPKHDLTQVNICLLVTNAVPRGSMKIKLRPR